MPFETMDGSGKTILKLQGIFASVATPFDHTGAIYKTKVQHNFEKWCRTSLSGFLIGGLAGEGPLLAADEKIQLMRLAAPHVPEGRIAIVDISADGVDVAATLARQASEAGAHFALSMVPHQYRNMMYGPETQSLYFRALADRSPVPVIIHNSPQLTGVDLLAETAAALAEHPNIAGIVESGSPVVRIQQLRAAVNKSFAVLAGTEMQALDSLKAGANGAVLAFASAAPYAAIAIWEAFRTREEEAAIDWQQRISHPSILVTDLYGVPGLKHAMDLNGYYGGVPRLPFVPLAQAARDEIESSFRDLKN